MDAPTPPAAAGGPAVKLLITALAQHISELRRDLQDTFELIERLRATCVTMEAKLVAAEEHQALLVNHATEWL